MTAFVFGACESTDPNLSPSLVPAETFDAMMRNYQTNGRPDVIQLAAGTYLTRGSSAWTLAAGDSIVGAGMKRTVIRRMDTKARAVINGWTPAGNNQARIADLTIDANAKLAGKEAACGIIGLNWTNCTVERVQVIRLGSYVPKESESFGIMLSCSTDCAIRNCVVERNVAGYVSAFTISGRNTAISNSRADFSWVPGWDTRLQAFCLAGAADCGGSSNLSIINNRTSNARFAVFCDTGKRIDGITIAGNRCLLRTHQNAFAQGIRLVGGLQYTNVKMNGNYFRIVE